ncbi:cytochrome b5-like [Coffea arabica]|uniref:Cytochrome b5-like n=1 Tax=Coffea arabica TaxID=13443 RepID=A0A6P6VZJ5_COFAR|nr:cytochrome b5-like [Coffea arabica]XP_027115518.1 cytochrome b5-like [Coffea arabica]
MLSCNTATIFIKLYCYFAGYRNCLWTPKPKATAAAAAKVKNSHTHNKLFWALPLIIFEEMTDRRVYVFDEVARHHKRGDTWLIISGKVYDVSLFLDDHPGGDEALLAVTGKDATIDFDEQNHSEEARKMLVDYYIGDVDISTLPVEHEDTTEEAAASAGIQTFGGLVKILQFLIPLIILGLALALRQYKNKE